MPPSRQTRQPRSGLWLTASVTAVAVAVILFVASPVVADGFPQQQKQQQPLSHGRSSPLTDASFRSLVADTLTAWHVPGVSIAVLDGDNTWSEGFGLAVVEPPTPATRDTLFYTASTTKAFVAAALSLLVDKKDDAAPDAPIPINWTTPLATVLGDDFVIAGDPWATAHLTIEDALCHRTGLAAHDLSRSRQYGLVPGGGPDPRNATVGDVTRSLRHLPLSTSPRTAWRYCNLMFLVLSHVVETLAGGRWLGSVLHSWLWTPLGMKDTFLSLDDARAAAPPAFLAQGYYWETDENVSQGGYVAVPHMPLEEVSGAGGIISTVADYAKWLRCWIDGPHGSTATSASGLTAACGGIPFSKAGLDAILAPKMFLAHTAASPEPYDAPMAYASAWMTSSYKGHRFWGHSGGSNAFGAQVYFFPDDRFGVVLFGNTAITSNAAELILLWHLVDERFGIPADQRYDWEKRFRNAAVLRKARVDNALDHLFPHRANPPLPPALSVDAYVGTYHHPTYQNLTLRVQAEDEQQEPSNGKVVFVADRYAHTWPTRCEFIHVSGEWWLLYTDMLYERSGHFRSYGRAQFHIGADGQAHTLEVEFWNADDDTVEGVFSFERLA